MRCMGLQPRISINVSTAIYFWCTANFSYYKIRTIINLMINRTHNKNVQNRTNDSCPVSFCTAWSILLSFSLSSCQHDSHTTQENRSIYRWKQTINILCVSRMIQNAFQINYQHISVQWLDEKKKHRKRFSVTHFQKW